jgi:mRNA-degrading endonuclease RelE of RelBE toxin-antitoxin system
MVYEIEFKPRAMKDLKSIDRRDAHRVLEKIKAMRNDQSIECDIVRMLIPKRTEK